jgi:hypothetical protein
MPLRMISHRVNAPPIPLHANLGNPIVIVTTAIATRSGPLMLGLLDAAGSLPAVI